MISPYDLSTHSEREWEEERKRQSAELAAEVRRLRAMLEPTPDARELVNHLFGVDLEMYTRYSPMYIKVLQQQNEAAQLIAAHDARLLDEAAERGVRLVLQDGWLPGVKTIEDLADAIKGAAHE